MKSKLISFISKNKIKIFIGFGLFLFMFLPIFNNKNILTMLTNNISGSNQYTEEVKSIEIESDDYANNTPGSWHITKSAEWTGVDTAKISFNLDTNLQLIDRDVVLVVSHSTPNWEYFAENLNRLITQLLNSNSDRKIAIVSNNTRGDIVSDFTNDEELLHSKINTLPIAGGMLYNVGIEEIYDYLVENNQHSMQENNHDFLVLTLVDLFPTTWLGGTYSMFYDYDEMKKNTDIEFATVYYEMGDYPDYYIEATSDRTYPAGRENLYQTLLNAVSKKYEKFEVIDYINPDYFEVANDTDIIASSGTVKLEEENGKQKITWNLDNMYTGRNQDLRINVKLKDVYVGSEGFYPTNDGESVTYKIESMDARTINSNKTPVLKRDYKVTYDMNTPTGCNIANIVQTHYAFEKVTLIDDLKCDGYLFKGWKYITSVNSINDDIFIMPTNDVIIRAVWSKQSISKSMDGKIAEVATLYNKMKNDAENAQSVDTYEGEVTDTYNITKNSKIYYYKGETPSNNVIFGGFCWQMIRTTASGGVKLIYNGTPTNGKCNNSGVNSLVSSVEYYTENWNSLAYTGYMYNKTYNFYENTMPSGVLFGADVSYDGNNYTLLDTQNTMDENHHYTCNNTTGVCSTVRFYYLRNGTRYKYVELENVDNIQAAMREMLSADDVNKYESNIKVTIENWFKNNLLSYSNYLQDTVYCNNRTLSETSNYSYNKSGWNPNGGSYTTRLAFSISDQSPTSVSLKCENITDRFSVSNESAKLKYPVGLLSSREVLLSKINPANTIENHYLKIDSPGTSTSSAGTAFWLSDSYTFWPTKGMYQTFFYKGSISGMSVDCMQQSGDVNYVGVRPVITLKADMEYTTGDGTKNNPYVVATN